MQWWQTIGTASLHSMNGSEHRRRPTERRPNLGRSSSQRRRNTVSVWLGRHTISRYSMLGSSAGKAYTSYDADRESWRVGMDECIIAQAEWTSPTRNEGTGGKTGFRYMYYVRGGSCIRRLVVYVCVVEVLLKLLEHLFLAMKIYNSKGMLALHQVVCLHLTTLHKLLAVLMRISRSLWQKSGNMFLSICRLSKSLNTWTHHTGKAAQWP